MRTSSIGWLGIALLLASVVRTGRQQQPPPVAQRGAAEVSCGPGGTPAGITWPSPALPTGPIVLETGIQRNIKLFVTKGLNQPFSMAFA